MKVVFGVDGSTESLAAVAFAGRLMTPGRDFAVFYNSPPSVTMHGRRTPEDIVQRARRAVANAVFEKSRDHLPAPLRESIEFIVDHQKPQTGLLHVSEDHHADLLVVGARGAGPIKGLHIGSVSQAIAHHANIPVLIVRHRAVDQTGEPLRVLFACDRSPASVQAARALKMINWPPSAIGRVVTVIESTFAASVPKWLEEEARRQDTEAFARAWVEDHDQHLQNARRNLTQYCAELPDVFHAEDPVVVEGHPAEQILRAIDRDPVDLIIVGSRGLGAMGRVFLGSTSHRLLTRAPCSVLIARQQTTYNS